MAKLGTKKRPAIVRVRTEKRAKELYAVCVEHGWQVIVGIEPDKPEDISDVTRLLKKAEASPEAPPGFKPRLSANDYCPCGSGKKVKNCCGLAGAEARVRADRSRAQVGEAAPETDPDPEVSASPPAEASEPERREPAAKRITAWLKRMARLPYVTNTESRAVRQVNIKKETDDIV